MSAAYEVLLCPRRRETYDRTGSTDKPVRNEVEIYVAQVITPLLGKSKDPIAEARRQIEQKLQGFREKRRELLGEVTMFTLRLQKFSEKNSKIRNTTGRELIEGILRSQIDHRERAVEKIDSELEVGGRMLDMLVGLKYPTEVEGHDDRRTVTVTYTM